MDKANDIEKIINKKATNLTLVFYEVSLLGYSIYTYLTSGRLEVTFTIFMMGLIVYFSSNFIYNQKLK